MLDDSKLESLRGVSVTVICSLGEELYCVQSILNVVGTATEIFLYTVLQKYAHTGLRQKLLRWTTLDIITRLLDNAVFVCVHPVGCFLKISRSAWVEKSRISASG